MSRSIVHGSFTIVRHLKHAPMRVFDAFAKEEAKRKWFGGPGAWEEHERRFDFREGGREIVKGKHEGGTVHSFDCLYRDIVEPAASEAGRIIYSYVMQWMAARFPSPRPASRSCRKARAPNWSSPNMATSWTAMTMPGHANMAPIS